MPPDYDEIAKRMSREARERAMTTSLQDAVLQTFSESSVRTPRYVLNSTHNKFVLSMKHHPKKYIITVCEVQ